VKPAAVDLAWLTGRGWTRVTADPIDLSGDTRIHGPPHHGP